jgi:hypothetical protein
VVRTLRLGLLLLPAIAAADVARYRTTLDVYVDTPDMTAAILTDILLTTDRKTLDACWRKPGTVKVNVVFDKGTVASVDPIGDGGDRNSKTCISEVLRAITLANSTSRVTATFELVGFAGSPPSRPPPPLPKVAASENGQRAILDSIIDRNLSTTPGKFTGLRGDTSISSGGEHGTGAAREAGDSGSVEGTFVSKGMTAPGRSSGSPPRAVKIDLGQPPTGTFHERTVDEIRHVVIARAGVLRACYQKELNRTPGIAGKVVVRFSIQPDGSVSPGLMDTATTMLTAEEVILCIKRNIDHLKFRVTTSPSEVSYPFEFSAGSDGAPPNGADRSRTPPP